MGPVGETRTCPHCGEVILRSAAHCPACQRRLRFDGVTQARSAPPPICPFRIEGVIRPPDTDTPWEYSVVVEVRNSQGAVLNRRVVGVGAIRPGDTRTVTLQVEMRVAEESAQAVSPSRLPTPERKKQETTIGPRPKQASTTESPSPPRPAGSPEERTSTH